MMATVYSTLTMMAPYLALAACILLLVCIIFIIMLSRRLERVSAGANGTLEETLKSLKLNSQELMRFRVELEQYLKHAESRLRTSLRGVAVVRYNPFANDGSSGGNQSFAIAFLDESQSGVVISALYARNHVGVYAKPIENGKSPLTLSDEESSAVTKAIASMGARKGAAESK